MGYRFGELVIEPVSAFGTPLKGDTVFGHLCWILFWCPDLLKGSLARWLEVYGEEPFVIVSSAFPSCGEVRYFPRPALPTFYFLEGLNCEERLKKRKEVKAKRWVRVEKSLVIDISRSRLLSGKEVAEELGLSCGDLSFSELSNFFLEEERIRNSISRKTFTTGEGGFSPYGLSEMWFLPGLTLSLYVIYLEEALSAESLLEAFRIMGAFGFGRDASVGLGRFKVVKFKEHPLPDTSAAKAFLALSPFVPEKDDPQEILFEPFVRFGRHGGPLAVSPKPFKNPILMADEGALIRGNLEKPFVGRALRGLSEVLSETVSQGYAPVIPVTGDAI